MRNYFEAMQIPVLRGRAFTPGDGLGDEPVAVVNQQLARRLFGDSDPLGRRVRMGPDSSSPWITIVGVVGDIRHTNLETPPLPELYVNYASNPPNSPFLAIRTSGSPAVLGEIVRRELRAVDPSLAPFDMRTMTDRRADSVASRRFVMVIVGACTLLALLLAAVGVYGVVALVVAHRVPEMGVRLALGAHPRSVQRLVIGHALARAAAGVATGMGAAALLAPLLRSQLFGVTAADPWTFIASPVVLIVVAVVAALVPAGRAMRIDPVAALRQ
jgi:predicted permease